MKNDRECLTNITLPKKLYDNIEEKAILRYFKHNIKSVPLDPFGIAKDSGYILRPYSSIDKDAYLFLKKSGQDVISHFNPDLKTYTIYYNDEQCIERQRFTVMHEIGHIDMEHKNASQLAETVANHYAAYALAPSPLIQKYNCEDYADISAVFNVSEKCAYLRFKNYQNWEKYGISKTYEIKLLKHFNN